MKSNGTIAKRFQAFRSTDFPMEDYSYAFSIPEIILFGVADAFMKASYLTIVIVGSLTAPIWAIPYVLYTKASEKRQRQGV